MNCNEASDLFLELKDGSLEPAVQEAVKTHLAACGSCAKAYRDYCAVVALAGELRNIKAAPSPFAEDTIIERVTTIVQRRNTIGYRFRHYLPLTATALAAVLAIVIASNDTQYGEQVLREISAERHAPPMETTPPPPAQTPTVDVLHSMQRIEEGTRIESYMLDSQPVAADRVPEGALLGKDKQAVVGKFAKETTNSNLPLTADRVTDVQPLSALNVPPGYRAVTIAADTRQIVEGDAKPNTRVDVLWSYTDKTGQKAVSTIVRFAKVLSISGMSTKAAKSNSAGNGGATTTTVLVAERDAKKIELARTLGNLSLSLVGQEEPEKIAGDDPDPISINDIIGSNTTAASTESDDGKMYMTDPKTGKQVVYVLRRSCWARGDDGHTSCGGGSSSSVIPKDYRVVRIKATVLESDPKTDWSRRFDVHWSYKEKSGETRSGVVRFVLVTPPTAGEASLLLLKEEDARNVERALEAGTVSISLSGEEQAKEFTVERPHKKNQ